MRRRPGLSGLQRKKREEAKFKNVGEKIEQTQMENVAKQLAQFKDSLEIFANKHRNQINKNPVFRHQFQKMCSQAGVDPLASNKGFWAELLGVGDFYYELAVQVIDVCVSTQHHNGGLLRMEELLGRLTASRGKQAQLISEDDVCRAIEKVAVLGNGFRVLKMKMGRIVVSVPVEMSHDHANLINMAQGQGYVLASACRVELGWPVDRVNAVLTLMMKEGMVWRDDQMDSGEPAYWFQCLFDQAGV